MSTEVARPNVVQRLVTFIRDVRGELDKVTWPDWPQARQLAIIVVLFTLFIGLVIALMDLVLQGLLQNLIPGLFGRR
jgi:preprotein translocase SecE subunit